MSEGKASINVFVLMEVCLAVRNFAIEISMLAKPALRNLFVRKRTERINNKGKDVSTFTRFKIICKIFFARLEYLPFTARKRVTNKRKTEYKKEICDACET